MELKYFSYFGSVDKVHMLITLINIHKGTENYFSLTMLDTQFP